MLIYRYIHILHIDYVGIHLATIIYQHKLLIKQYRYSLYNLWYLRSGWCKFVQPFGLLSHVDCTDEPSVVRHHSMEFSASSFAVDMESSPGKMVEYAGMVCVSIL